MGQTLNVVQLVNHLLVRVCVILLVHLRIVDQNVCPIQNVQVISLAYNKNVKTHVPDYAAQTLNAVLLATRQCVYALLALSEIRLLNAWYSRVQFMNNQHRVRLVHVDQMLFVMNKTVPEHVYAYRNTLEIHTKVVGPNVS